MFGFTIFVFDDTTQLFDYIRLMFGVTSTGFVDGSILNYLVNYGIIILLAFLFAMPLYKVIENKLFNSENEKIRKISSAVGVVVFVGLFVVTVSYIVNASYSPFLYFRF